MPEEPYTIPFGEADIVREGDDVTVVALGRMVPLAEQAAEQLAAEGIECEMIDPRTTSPLDEETIFESVENTGRLVVVDEANPRCWHRRRHLGARRRRSASTRSRRPPQMVTAPHTPVAVLPALEDLYIPGPERIADGGRATSPGRAAVMTAR